MTSYKTVSQYVLSGRRLDPPLVSPSSQPTARLIDWGAKGCRGRPHVIILYN